MYISHLSSDLGLIRYMYMHIMLLNICKLHKNWGRKVAIFFCKKLNLLWQLVSLWKKRKPWYILCTTFTILFFH